MSNTKNINVNAQRPPTNIPLGRQGENLATCIIFDCTGLAQLYGDGTAELLHELKDGTVYPVAIKQDGTSVSWIVTASDTATVGAGRAELRWYVGDTLAKSAKFRTSVSSALADTTTETPPAPQKAWVDQVLAAAQEIKDGAISDEKLAAAIAAYLADHPIDAGLDEAALAAYLVENGYLKNTDLADAVAKALADAKASGEFDGAPGVDGADGSPGADGVDGVGIQSVMQTTTSAEDGGTNVITVTKTDGSTSTFEVRNGSKGNDGAPGADGKDGADGQPGTDGKSAYQYAQDGGYTGTETEFAAKLAKEFPNSLPNPNALTFSGGVSGSYDGSSPVTINIPSGAGAETGSGGNFVRKVYSIDVTDDVSYIDIDLGGKYSILWASISGYFPAQSKPSSCTLYIGNADELSQYALGLAVSNHRTWGSDLILFATVFNSIHGSQPSSKTGSKSYFLPGFYAIDSNIGNISGLSISIPQSGDTVSSPAANLMDVSVVRLQYQNRTIGFLAGAELNITFYAMEV